ncbi:hypothetical protein PV735_46765 [Streptomyces turgidiscabies]|uniref:Uncharacterized protein n=1 Tax=Streptomyces turgidiscabies (strain Car8) TaxID=698760 RepID=L7EX16_STRT8|nr:hypothetical protein [Streptomyces turgidiscabies]ELP62935.1 hypothetical protein STRTUCAR8_00041 [Streptomyces turgidiscabies Car8]MDX3500124.1 hypothetical protein [Streptomyces turgidiscabies]GAQ77206.1 hypothetical protein T45_09022 [Streptomyces turgidiscabies]
MTPPDQLPAWYSQQLPPPAPLVQHNGLTLLVAHSGRVVPVITTSTALILARIWHEQGAAHSVGNMALMLALAAGSFAAACVSAVHRNGDPATTAVAFTGAGAFALLGPVAYTESWALSALLWLVATVLVYVVTARHWRAAHQLREARDHELTLARLDSATTVATAVIAHDAKAQALAYGLTLARAVEQRIQLDPTTYDHAVLQKAGLPELPASDH